MKQLSLARDVVLTGKFSPFMESGHVGVPDQPVLVRLHNEPGLRWCVVFSDVEDLREAMRFCGITGYKIKQIEDGKDFAESILESGMIRLMLDPRIMGKEKTRWTEIVLQ